MLHGFMLRKPYGFHQYKLTLTFHVSDAQYSELLWRHSRIAYLTIALVQHWHVMFELYASE